MTNRGKRWYGGTSGIAMTVAAGALLHAAPAFAQVSGGRVVAGQATISGQGTSQTTITQTSDRAIVNWDRFSLREGDMAVFQQPDARSITVNRVTGADPSTILGSIQANGQVVLINRNGVLFGKGSKVDTAGLIVSTHDIDAQGFMRGDSLLRFNDGGNNQAEIVVEGRITIRDAGMAAFVAPHVRHSGLITADMGRVSLAAGKGFGIDLYGDGLVRFATSDAITGTLKDAKGQPIKALVENDGTIAAQGGKILLTATAAREVVNASVNVAGIVRADSVSAQGGVITLSGTSGITTEAGSVISAAGATGGSVTISGGSVGLGGLVDASSTGIRQVGGSVAVRADGLLSLGGTTRAVSALGSGGSVTYQAARLSENSDGRTDVSGLIDGGTIRSLITNNAMSSGRYFADGIYGLGGRIDMTATDLRLLSATVSATGRGGGGLVRLGGAFQGGKTPDTTQPYYQSFLGRWGVLPDLAAAGHAFVNDGTLINVASSRGQGGTAVIWSDAQTTFLGAIDARGSGAKGSGGAVEISSAKDLRRTELRHVLVGGGNLLLDPKNIVIGDAVQAASWAYQGIIGKWYAVPGIAQLEAGDLFGISVALNSDATVMAVGASGDAGATNATASAGAVYIFKFADSNFNGGILNRVIGKGYTGGGNWDLSDLSANDQFGISVALDGAGMALAVGAIGDDGAGNYGGSNNYGAVYLFRLNSDGSTYARATLGYNYYASSGKGTPNGMKFNELRTGDGFGRSVAFNSAGDKLAIGAVFSDGFDGSATDVGAVYLVTGLQTGASANGVGTKAGAISFSGSGTSGTNFSVANLEAKDSFGQSVSLNADGTRLAVGAWGDRGTANKRASGTTGASTGAVYLISFGNTSFGSPHVDGIIGAGYTGANDINVGPTSSFAYPINAGNAFGAGVALNGAGDRLFVGASNTAGAAGNASGSGSVYLFSFGSSGSSVFGTGSVQGVLGTGYSGGNSHNVIGVQANSFFGISVATDQYAKRLAVGTLGDSGAMGTAPYSGAVRLFTFSDTGFGGFVQASTIGNGYNRAAPALDASDYFGWSVALNANATRMAVGAVNDDGLTNGFQDAGAVYLFSFSDSSFNGGTLQGIIGKGYTGGKNVNVSQLEAQDNFGTGVALSADGTKLAVGAYGDDGSGNTPSTNNNYGAVYLFSFSDGNFTGGTQRGVIGSGYTISVPGLDKGDSFGSSVAFNAAADRLAIGASHDDGFGAGSSSADYGAVYLYGFDMSDATTPFKSPTLLATIGSGYGGSGSAGNNLGISVSGLPSGAWFGNGVALNGTGDRLAVGAPNETGAGVSGAGAAYLFGFSSAIDFAGAALIGKLGNGESGANHVILSQSDRFATSVALDATGDRLAVGAPTQSDQTNGGAVYLFAFDGTSAFHGVTLNATVGRVVGSTPNIPIVGGTASNLLGSSVALSADATRLATGAINDADAIGGTAGSGTVRVFTFTDGKFAGGAQAGTIGKGYNDKNIDLGGYLDPSDGLGFGVALNADATRLAVGAYRDGGFGNVGTNRGAVYLFSFTDSNFSGGRLQSIIGSGYTSGKNYNLSTLDDEDNFGRSVAFNAAGDRLAVGASGDAGAGNSGSNTGAVYLFKVGDFASSSPVTLLATLGKGYSGGSSGSNLGYSSSGLDTGDLFGVGVALNAAGDVLAVGASGDDGYGAGATSDNYGAVYLFKLTSDSNGISAVTTPRLLQHGNGLTAPITNYTFGSSVALNASGDRMAVSALGDRGASGSASLPLGAVYLFGLDNSNSANPFNPTLIGRVGLGYTSMAKDVNVPLAAVGTGLRFGAGIALNADASRLAIGAPGAPGTDGSGNSLTGPGQLYVLDFSDSSFSGGSVSAQFGRGVSGAVDVGALEAGDKFGSSVALNARGNRMVIGANYDGGAGNVSTGSGAIYLFSIAGSAGVSLNQTYGTTAADTVTIGAAAIANQLAQGTTVTLQASNDITVNSAITVTGSSSNLLTLQAGRSVLINANITSNGGGVNLIANDKASNGVVDAQRDSGAAAITMASGTSINAGTTGDVYINLRNGAGLTNATSGNITLTTITGKTVTAINEGPTAGSGVVLSSGASLTASATGSNAIVLAGKSFTNNAGASALSAANGKWQIWSTTPVNDTLGSLTYDFKQYNAAFNSGVTTLGSGNALYYSVAPTVTPTLAASTKTYDGTTTATAGTITCSNCTGINGDTLTAFSASGGTYDTTAAGAGTKTVTVAANAVTITAKDANNKPVYGYQALGALTNTASTIEKKALTITAPSIAAKTYDGTTGAGALTLGTLSGLVGSETVTATGTAGALSSANAGSRTADVSYTLANGTNGGLASNYTLATTTGVTALVNAKALTITAPSIAAKTYDGTTTAGTLTLGTLSGFVGSETVTASGTAGALSSANAGSRTADVSYTLANGINGGLASNYTLATTTGVTALVNAKALTITAPSIAA
ncbi:YDG domain-containing protein, partial [Sphingomonas sp. NCPPB 2930]|uniref:two-partner secretion domain-containing protein n=1 Tax=Sphingomonas sp. NCPPB 2930 TaxID=3162788 RepID=UPI0036DF5AB4